MAARKQSREPLGIDHLVELAAERVRTLGGCPIGKLGVPKARRPEVLTRLVSLGFEVTKSNVRQPLEAQLRAALASGAFLLLKSLKAYVVAATAAEAKLAALELVRTGQAHLVLRAGTPTVVPADAAVLGAEDLGILSRGLDAALKQVRKAAKAKAKLLRADVTAQIEPLIPRRALERDDAASLQPEQGASRPSLIEQARAAVEAGTEPSLGLAFVPAVVRLLSAGGGTSVAEAIGALREAAKRGHIELRPESGLGRLTSDERLLCLPGPEGSWLSWAKLGEEPLP